VRTEQGVQTKVALSREIHGLKCLYLAEILDTVPKFLTVISTTYLFWAHGLKIRASVVRFRPWPPFRSELPLRTTRRKASNIELW
jgi:hypothetical protein